MILALRRLLSGEVASNVAATMFGSFFAKGINALTLIYVMRVVGATSFGLLTFGISVVAYASMIVTPGMLVWGTRAVACEPGRTKTFVVLINSTQLFLACVAYALVAAISKAAFGPEELRIVLVTGAGLFSLALSVDWAYQGLQRFRTVTLGQVVASLCTLTATLLLVHDSSDLYFVPLTIAGGQIVAALLLTYLLWRSGELAGSVEWRQVGPIVRASLPLGVSLMLVTILHHANNIALQLTRGAHDLGVFAASYRIFELCCLLPALTANVFLPRIAAQNDDAKKHSEIRNLIRVALAGGAILAVMMSIESGPILDLLLGGKFAASAPVLRILGAALFFSFAAIAYITGLLGYRRDRTYFWALFVPMVIAVLGALFAVPRFGIVGATFTVAVLDLATVVTCMPTYHRVIGSMFLEEWIRPLASGGLSAALLLAMRYAGVLFPVRLIVVLIVYAALVIPWTELRHHETRHHLDMVGEI